MEKINNKQEELESQDHNSDEDLSEEQYLSSTKSSKQKKETSELFNEYSKFLRGVSVKDYLTKYSQSLKASKISFNEHCFQQEMSLVILKHTKNFEVVTLFVSFSHFSFEISVASLNEYSLVDPLLQILGRGSYGKIYQAKINDLIVAIKSIQFSPHLGKTKQKTDNKQASNIISKAIFEYCLYKLFSVFEIGPKVINIFGFDLLICKNSIQFSMQKCQTAGHNKSQQSLYNSLNFIHSLGIIHGDIKLDNIMWSSSFQKWVFIDFGLSQVLSEKPGEKTFTKYFGTFHNSSQQMKNLFYSQKKGYVDLYFNDLFGLKVLFEQIVISQKEVQKSKKVYQIKPYANFIQNSRLVYIFYSFDEDSFTKFCLESSKAFQLLRYFWDVIKMLDSQRYFTWLKRLSEVIVDPENMIHSFLTSSSTGQISKKRQQVISFQWRFQQRANNFNGAIDDFMLFSLIYFNFDISPHRFLEKQIFLKTFITKFDPFDVQSWKYLVKFLKNPYISYSQVADAFEIVRKTIGIENWLETQMKEYQLHIKGRQIAGLCLQKYGFNLFKLSFEEYLFDPYPKQGALDKSYRIFQYQQFSDLIKLHSNGFPYIQFLSTLQKDIKKSQLYPNCIQNLKKTQQKYKINIIPKPIKYLLKFNQLQFNFLQENQVKNTINSFHKIPNFQLLTISKYLFKIHQFTANSSIIYQNINPQINNHFYKIFTIDQSIDIFSKQNIQIIKNNINPNNIQLYITKYKTYFPKFLPQPSINYFYFILYIYKIYIYTLQQFYQYNINIIIIQQLLIQYIYQILNQYLYSIQLFLFICRIFTKSQIVSNPKYSLKFNPTLFKLLFNRFESQPLNYKNKIAILQMKIKIFEKQKYLFHYQLPQLLSNIIQTVKNIKSESQKKILFSHQEILTILLRYLLSFDQFEEQKYQEIQHILLKYSYHQNGNLRIFPIVLQTISIIYTDRQYSQFPKFYKIVMQGTYFKNKEKHNSQQLQKFFNADHALQCFIMNTVLMQKMEKKFTKSIFAFFKQGIDSQKGNFFIKNGNAILLIEKAFKFFFLGIFELTPSQIRQMLKISSQLVGYSNLAFSRSFHAAMNYWLLQLLKKGEIKLNLRKFKIMSIKFARNWQYNPPEQFFIKFSNFLHLTSKSSKPKPKLVFANFKWKIEKLNKTKLQLIEKSKSKTNIKFIQYIHFLQTRQNPLCLIRNKMNLQILPFDQRHSNF